MAARRKGHKILAATAKNLAQDARNKLALETAFKNFEKVFRKAARSCSRATVLRVPLQKLRERVRVGTFGPILKPLKPHRPRRKVRRR